MEICFLGSVSHDGFCFFRKRIMDPFSFISSDLVSSTSNISIKIELSIQSLYLDTGFYGIQNSNINDI